MYFPWRPNSGNGDILCIYQTPSSVEEEKVPGVPSSKEPLGTMFGPGDAAEGRCYGIASGDEGQFWEWGRPSPLCLPWMGTALMSQHGLRTAPSTEQGGPGMAHGVCGLPEEALHP